MDNARYAELLEETSALMQVRGDNPFKIRAMQKAARVVSGLAESIDDRLDAGTIMDLDGIGKSLARDLEEMRSRGSTGLLDDLRASLPDGITDLLKVQGLGPKKVKKVYDELGIGDLDALEEAANSGQIASLAGFGAKSQARILTEIERLRRMAGRTPFHRAWPIAQQILERLRALDGVERAEIAGSLRRHRETVGDLDFVVASTEPAPIMAAFAGMDEVTEVIGSGDTKTSVWLDGDFSADLRVVPPEVFGATLHHFTGSKDHNVAMRSRALKRGLRISEWGVFRVVEGGDDELVASATEEAVYEAAGLPWIPPEIREDRGEIEAAESDDLPALIELSQIRGDLHMHTTWSDGRHSVAEMAEAARDRGLGFIAITDHSRALTVANGLDRDRLLAQMDEIDAWNEANDGFRVLKGLEVDILDEGAIDMDVDVLERLDWAVGSVHSRMRQDADTMTRRLVAAVESGLISAIGHPTGRLIGTRDPYEFDLAAVLDACEAHGVALEINASPERLDLNDRMIRQVLARPSLWLTINTDAHSTSMLGQMRFGVGMARRGGVTANRVLNALDLDAFLAARRAPKAA